MQLVEGFSLGVSCSSELQLRLDGFTLPAGSNPCDMLREGDLLVVTRLASNAGQIVPAAAKQNQRNAIKQMATAAQPGLQQQPNGGQAQPQGARQQTPAGEGRKQKRKAAAAGRCVQGWGHYISCKANARDFAWISRTGAQYCNHDRYTNWYLIMHRA